MIIILVTLFHVLVSILLIFIVLMQQGKGQDLASAFGGGGSQTAFGARGTATLLSKLTAGCAISFMVTSLTLGYLKPAVVSGGSSTVVPDLPAASEPPEGGVETTPGNIPEEIPEDAAEGSPDDATEETPETPPANPASQPPPSPPPK